jgi:hypothetical protein
VTIVDEQHRRTHRRPAAAPRHEGHRRAAAHPVRQPVRHQGLHRVARRLEAQGLAEGRRQAGPQRRDHQGARRGAAGPQGHVRVGPRPRRSRDERGRRRACPRCRHRVPERHRRAARSRLARRRGPRAVRAARRDPARDPLLTAERHAATSAEAEPPDEPPLEPEADLMPDSTVPFNAEVQRAQSHAVERIIARASALWADEPKPTDGTTELGGQ